METLQVRLNQDLKQGKSIAWWAVGYYIVHGILEHRVPVFEINYKDVESKQKHETTKVLIEYLGEMFYVNVRICDLFYGAGGYSDRISPSKEAKLLRLNLEMLNSTKIKPVEGKVIVIVTKR